MRVEDPRQPTLASWSRSRPRSHLWDTTSESPTVVSGPLAGRRRMGRGRGNGGVTAAGPGCEPYAGFRSGRAEVDLNRAQLKSTSTGRPPHRGGLPVTRSMGRRAPSVMVPRTSAQVTTAAAAAAMVLNSAIPGSRRSAARRSPRRWQHRISRPVTHQIYRDVAYPSGRVCLSPHSLPLRNTDLVLEVVLPASCSLGEQEAPLSRSTVQPGELPNHVLRTLDAVAAPAVPSPQAFLESLVVLESAAGVRPR